MFNKLIFTHNCIEYKKKKNFEIAYRKHAIMKATIK